MGQCYYVDFVNLNVDNVDNVMHLSFYQFLVLLIEDFSTYLKRRSNKFVIKASKIMAVRGPDFIPDPTAEILPKPLSSKFIDIKFSSFL